MQLLLQVFELATACPEAHEMELDIAFPFSGTLNRMTVAPGSFVSTIDQSAPGAVMRQPSSALV